MGFKFKAKAVSTVKELDELGIRHTDGWVEGNLISNGGEPWIVGDVVEACEDYIALEFWIRVKPESVALIEGGM